MLDLVKADTDSLHHTKSRELGLHASAHVCDLNGMQRTQTEFWKYTQRQVAALPSTHESPLCPACQRSDSRSHAFYPRKAAHQSNQETFIEQRCTCCCSMTSSLLLASWPVVSRREPRPSMSRVLVNAPLMRAPPPEVPVNMQSAMKLS